MTHSIPTFVALDFETANSDRSTVCALGLVRVESGRIVERVGTLVRPMTRRFSNRRFHGIGARDVEDAPTLSEIWPALAPLFRGAAFIAAHAAQFERSVLRACREAHDIELPPIELLCTVMLARRAWGVRPTRLPDVAKHLGLDLEHHDALSDARACAGIVIAAGREGHSLIG